MTPNKVTITDVARQASVSISTVSRVLNRSMPVSDELHARVMEAAKELNYHPNIMAQSLRRQSSAYIGIIIPDIRHTFFAEVVRGVEIECFRNERFVYWCNSDNDPEREVLHAEQLRRMGVEGVIFVGAFGWEHEDHIKDLCDSGIAVSAVNRMIVNSIVDLVLIDKTKGNYDATAHLLNLGHRIIGCIANLTYGGTGHEKLSSFRQALEEAGIEDYTDLIVETAPSFEGGYEAANRLLQRNERPTAIFARSDTLAIGAMRAAREMGLKVPEDLSIVGFGDDQIGKFLNPALTTIHQPSFEMGVKAASMLFERIVNKSLPQRQYLIQPRLIVRKSTAATE